MTPQQYCSAPLKVTDLSFVAIKEYLSARPYLLLPVGVLEPVGGLPVGAINTITEAVTSELSARLEILAAPLFAYGHTTPFQSFEGCSGLHASTLARSMYDCCNGWFFNGFKRIIIITCAMDGSTGIAPAVKRLNAHPLHTDGVSFISLQEDLFFRSYCEMQRGGKENGRSEWGIRTLYRYLCNYSDEQSDGAGKTGTDAKLFARWRKCGRDPEKLRKIAPDAHLSLPGSVDFEAGKALFGELSAYLTTQITSFITAGNNDS